MLAAVVLRDPTSWLQAAYNEWKHPASMEWVLLVQQLDAYLAVNSKNHKPTLMPWQAPITSGKPAVSESRVREILDAMRPKEN